MEEAIIDIQRKTKILELLIQSWILSWGIQSLITSVLIPRACLIISIYNDLCIVKNPIPGIKLIKKLKSVCLEKILPSAS